MGFTEEGHLHLYPYNIYIDGMRLLGGESPGFGYVAR